MKVLTQVPVNVFIHLSALVITFTIFLCYGIAVGLGHVKAWLPMISDCAVLPPEKYPFRYGFVVEALLLAVETVIIYNANKAYSKSKTCLVLGVTGAFCIGVVGVVNEQECNPVHSTAAVIFFFTYEAVMIMQTFYSQREPSVSSAALLIRQILTIYCGAALLAFIYFSTDWGKYGLYIAICEWSGTLTIIGYNWSYALDFNSYAIAEADETPSAEKKVPLAV
ncbi:hypothetical protein EMCRGX_G026470 [Ephydatia muelleri]|eukprot:Em0014g655a